MSDEPRDLRTGTCRPARRARPARRQPDWSSAWGAPARAVLPGGGRLLAAGNGGSAAEAQHLTAELVGRFQRRAARRFARSPCTPRRPALTAIGNDYGFEEVFARQVAAHGRPGDVLVLLSHLRPQPEPARRRARRARAAG